jgi:hypothetical protein
MKAILEFNLPEEAAEHRVALDGATWMSVCQELDQWLRSAAKYRNLETLKVSEVRARLHEVMSESGLRFDV